jgi:hypothetical protein
MTIDSPEGDTISVACPPSTSMKYASIGFVAAISVLAHIAIPKRNGFSIEKDPTM